MFVRLPNVPNVEHNLPVGSRLNPFREPWKPWGLYPRPTWQGHQRSISLWTRYSRASSKSLGFFSWPFLVPKLHSRWRPILGLVKPSLSETIRTSLQQGEWVTSVDFKDAYFHIPIQEQSGKYLRFHIQGRAYQFKALPFGLSTAPLEFTVIPKEVKLMAIHRDFKNPPVPRQLVGESQIPPGLSPTYTGTSK